MDWRPVSVFVLLPFCIGKERKPRFSGDVADARVGWKEAAWTAAGTCTAARPRRIDDLEIMVAHAHLRFSPAEKIVGVA